MNPWAWAAVASVAAGTLGWKLGRVSTLLEIARLQEVIENLRITQDHRRCKVIVGKLEEHIRWQEERLDAVERGPDAVIAEAEQFLREAGA